MINLLCRRIWRQNYNVFALHRTDFCLSHGRLRAKDNLTRSFSHTTEEPGPYASYSKVTLLVLSRIV